MSASALFLSGQVFSEAPKISSHIDMVFAQHNIKWWVDSNTVEIAGTYNAGGLDSWFLLFLDKIGTREVHNSEPVKLY